MLQICPEFFCAKLHLDISSIVGEKSLSTPCKKRGHAVPKLSLVDSSTERREHKQCNSKKSFVEQQEDSFMPQVGERNDKQDQGESSATHATEELKEHVAVSQHGNLKNCSARSTITMPEPKCCRIDKSCALF